MRSAWSLTASIPAIWAVRIRCTGRKSLCLWPAAKKIVDPVMGDNGKAYSTVTPALIDRIRALCVLPI